MMGEATELKNSIQPGERYRHLMYVVLGFTTRICGMSVILPNFRINIMTVLCVLVCILDLALCTYTMIGFSTEVAIKAFTNYCFTIQV